METKKKVVNGIKLNEFRDVELKQREMNSLVGGSVCTHACASYSDPGWYVSLCDLSSDLSSAKQC